MQGLGNKRLPMNKCLESAHDVRSRNVPTCAACESWVALKNGIHLRGHKVGEPVFAHEEMAKILEMPSTICGPERMVRHALPRRVDSVPNQQGAGALDSL